MGGLLLCYSVEMKKLEKDLKMLAKLQMEMKKLPPLSDVEQAKFEHLLAIDQLYYSNKLEGVDLTKEMIDAAIYGAASR